MTPSLVCMDSMLLTCSGVLTHVLYACPANQSAVAITCQLYRSMPCRQHTLEGANALLCLTGMDYPPL